MKHFETPKLHVKSWCNEPEAGAIEQAMNIAQLPFAYRHIALMPDTHQGYGMPIGGVLAANDFIVPNAVGVDIGCGMLAAQTNLTSIQEGEIKQIIQIIRDTVPMGFRHNETPVEIESPPENAQIVRREYDSARYQAGSLGGGNHFIEIQKGSNGFVWFMLHSGSRNLGKKVCDHYNKVAKQINEKYFSNVPKEWDLSFLPADTKEGQAYIAEMEYCQRFALENRKIMQSRISDAFRAVVPDFMALSIVNIHHNYARLENHFGKNVWVHRKGATSAKEGEIGIIPGSQGTKSYIVRGKGNPESFMSCSHGAGRRMGRKAAQRTLSLDDEINRMNELGIVHSIRSINDLDEAAGAYKDIDVVMAEQDDLVSIEVELTPLGVIKA